MNMRSTACSTVLWGVLLLGLCCSAPSASAGQPQPAAAGANYVDIHDYLPTWQQRDGWLDTLYWLKRDFNDVCGDTFCEGRYQNIEALSYRCSVQAATGMIGECVWTFAASEEDIDPDSGKVVVQSKLWQCPSHLVQSTRAEELAAALVNNRHPLGAPLPHTGKTLYEGLVDCLR